MAAASIQDRLEHLLTLPLGTIRTTMAQPAPPRAERVVPITSLRVIIVVEGRKREVFGTGDGLQDWLMQPGDVLVARDDTWLAPSFNTPHRHFGLVTASELANGGWFHCDGTADERRPLVLEADLDVAMPPRSALRQLCDALGMLEVHRDQETAHHLLIALLRLFRSAAIAMPPERSKAQRTWRRAIRFITDHADRPLGRTETAAFLSISENYLSRLCTQRGGSSFIEVVTQIRLQRASAMLRAINLPISSVATACGFSDTGYFIRRFRRAFGQTPGDYRRSQRSGDT